MVGRREHSLPNQGWAFVLFLEGTIPGFRLRLDSLQAGLLVEGRTIRSISSLANRVLRLYG